MKSVKSFFKNTKAILLDARSNFQRSEPIVYSAAIAFFTIFSLPAILIVVALAGTLFFSKDKVNTEIVRLAESHISAEAGSQISTVLDNVLKAPSGFWEVLISIVVVIKGATIVFFILQKALNSVWQVKVKSNVHYLTFLKHRLVTLALVAGLGLLLVLSLMLNTLLAIYEEELYALFEEYFTPAVKVVNTVFYLLVILSFFTAIHKTLPDAKVAWQDALAGGILTSILFLIGKQVINYILTSIKVVDIYAAAGSLVVVLLWIFYSSVILMLGAEVTRAYANNKGREVAPSSIAVKYEKVPGKEAEA